MKLTPLTLSIDNLCKVFKKFIPNIKSLEKRYRRKKQEILTNFLKMNGTF